MNKKLVRCTGEQPLVGRANNKEIFLIIRIKAIELFISYYLTCSYLGAGIITAVWYINDKIVHAHVYVSYWPCYCCPIEL